jgi:hypothetical protein
MVSIFGAQIEGFCQYYRIFGFLILLETEVGQYTVNYSLAFHQSESRGDAASGA